MRCSLKNPIQRIRYIKEIKDDAFCGCESLFNIEIIEFENEGIDLSEIKKGHKQTIRILKQVNKKKAESYAREHGFRTMFI